MDCHQMNNHRTDNHQGCNPGDDLRADCYNVLDNGAECEVADAAIALEGVKVVPLPLFGCTVPAGFPSPADDFIEEYLDLNQLLVKHQEATFFVRVAGNSMTGAGIYSGDILIVDRSLEPVHGKIIIAVVAGELTVKRLIVCNNQIILKAENPDYSNIVVEDEFRVWGVVTSVIHKV